MWALLRSSSVLMWSRRWMLKSSSQALVEEHINSIVVPFVHFPFFRVLNSLSFALLEMVLELHIFFFQSNEEAFCFGKSVPQVFPVLALSPTRLASSSILLFFSHICCLVSEINALSSARSRSSSFDVNLHLIISKHHTVNKLVRW